MDTVQDYTGHADTVLSGLRDAVDTADERILKLQMELELLEKKAQDEDIDIINRQLSDTSEMSDEDLEGVIDTSDDDYNKMSQSSMKPIDVVAASTKLYDELVCPKQPSCASDDSDISVLPNCIKDHRLSECDDSSTDEKEVNERWGCLKRVLTKDSSDESRARNDLFKQILQATEKTPNANQKISKKKSRSPTAAKFRMAYDGLFSTRGNNSSTSANTTNRKKTSKESSHNSGQSKDNQRSKSLYQTPSTLTSSRTEESHCGTHVLEEMRMENQKLHNMLTDEKKHSDKLCDKICDLEKDVEELQIRIELKEHEDSTGKIAELVEEIQKAQKLRENAMLERIHIASRDRDDAVMRAKAMFLKKNTSTKDTMSDKEKKDQTMMDLVDNITDADSAAIIERYGNELLERMSNLKNARTRITEEEMAIVMRERDDAVAKCHNLEQELMKCIEKLTDIRKSQKVSINTHLKEKVLSTEEDCKKAHVRLLDAEEEIKNLKSSYRIFKSQANWQDEELAKRYNGCLRSIQAEADLKMDHAKKMERRNHQLLEKLSKSKGHIQSMRQENAKLKEGFNDSQEKCGKLERLVRVLRKKLISQAQHPMTDHE